MLKMLKAFQHKLRVTNLCYHYTHQTYHHHLYPNHMGCNFPLNQHNNNLLERSLHHPHSHHYSMQNASEPLLRHRLIKPNQYHRYFQDLLKNFLSFLRYQYLSNQSKCQMLNISQLEYLFFVFHSFKGIKYSSKDDVVIIAYFVLVDDKGKALDALVKFV